MTPKRLCVLTVCSLLVTFSTGEACGDKFIIVGRGTRSVPRAHRPASILLYLDANTHSRTAARELHFESVAKAAGHRLTVVKESAGLGQAFQTRGFDVVMADPAERAALGPFIRSARSQPTFVALVHGAGTEAATGARGLLGEIDSVMNSRSPSSTK